MRVARFSGWNCVAKTLSLGSAASTIETKLRPLRSRLVASTVKKSDSGAEAANVLGCAEGGKVGARSVCAAWVGAAMCDAGHRDALLMRVEGDRQ